MVGRRRCRRKGDGRPRSGVGLERREAVDDAMVGHVEKMSEIIAQLVEEAGGEQYRCPQCGSFGPKASDH